MRASKYDVLHEVWKSMAIPSIMHMVAWNDNEVEKLEVRENRIARMALNAPGIEALRESTRWSTFRARHV